MMLWYGMAPGWSFALVPLLTFGLVIAALGVGTLLSALTVAYRDFRHVGAVPGSVLDVCHAVHLPADRSPAGPASAGSCSPQSRLRPDRELAPGDAGRPDRRVFPGRLRAVSVLLLLVGCLYFRRVESDFADII